MGRVFVARWAMVDALAAEIDDLTYNDPEWSPREIAEHLIKSGWRPVDEDD